VNRTVVVAVESEERPISDLAIGSGGTVAIAVGKRVELWDGLLVSRGYARSRYEARLTDFVPRPQQPMQLRRKV
jgi:hypothetical protein